jgi:hypothetical protein
MPESADIIQRMNDTAEFFRFAGWQVKLLLEREGFPINPYAGLPDDGGRIGESVFLPTHPTFPRRSTGDSWPAGS